MHGYSVWFADTRLNKTVNASTLFGGYVRNFFEKLTVLNIRNSTKATAIATQLNQVWVRNQGAFNNCTDHIDKLFDTGTYSSRLPYDTFTNITTALSNMGSNNDQFIDTNTERTSAVCSNCRDWDSSEVITFQFDDPSIPTPLSTIVAASRKRKWITRNIVQLEH